MFLLANAKSNFWTIFVEMATSREQIKSAYQIQSKNIDLLSKKDYQKFRRRKFRRQKFRRKKFRRRKFRRQKFRRRKFRRR